MWGICDGIEYSGLSIGGANMLKLPEMLESIHYEVEFGAEAENR